MVQWQNASFPSLRRGSDSPRPLQERSGAIDLVDALERLDHEQVPHPVAVRLGRRIQQDEPASAELPGPRLVPRTLTAEVVTEGTDLAEHESPTLPPQQLLRCDIAIGELDRGLIVVERQVVVPR